MLIAVKLLFLTFLTSSSGYEFDVESIATDHLSGSEDTSVTSLLLALLGRIRDLEEEVNALKLNDADQSLKLATLPYIENDIEDLKQNDDKQDLSLTVLDRTLTTLEAKTNEQELKISGVQTDISSLLDSNLKQDSAITALNSSLTSLESSDAQQNIEINDLDLNFTQLKFNDDSLERAVLEVAEKESCDGVIYQDTCIELLYTVGHGAESWTTATSMCQFHGGRLAEIETDELFNQVYKYIKKSWNAHLDQDYNYVNVLLGMKYMNGQLVFESSGNSVPGDSIGFWQEDYPKNDSSYMYMRMRVPAKRPTSPQRVEDGEIGFFNHPNDVTEAVPLCQFPLII